MYILLYVITAIILFLIAISFIPVIYKINYINKNFTWEFKIWWIKIDPRKFKKEKLKDKDDKKQQKEKKPKSSLKKIKEGINTARDIVDRLPFRVIVKNLYLRFTVVGEDAAKTAIEYGGACAVIFGFIGFIQNFCNLKDPDVLITPGFEEKEEHFEFSCIIYTRLGNIILALVRFMVYSIIRKNKE